MHASYIAIWSQKINVFMGLKPGSVRLSSSMCTNDAKKKDHLRILFFGSDAFSLGSLKKLVTRLRNPDKPESNIGNVQVVSSEPPLYIQGKKKQKSQEFIDYVRRNKLELHKWNKDDISLLTTNFDFGVVASFGHLIPKKVINNFKRGIINAHPSLLPKWRGAAPIIHTVLNGDTEAGVTIIDLSVGRFDRGNIFTQKQIKIDKKITTEDLTAQLAELSGDMVLDAIYNFDYYKEHKFSQPNTCSSHASKISAEMSYIKWSQDTCCYLERLHRAIGVKIGVHAFWNDKIVKFADISIPNSELSSRLDSMSLVPYNSGKVLLDKKNNSLCIKCIDGWIEVSKLQVEYKKLITGRDFHNAYMVDRTTKGIKHDQFS